MSQSRAELIIERAVSVVPGWLLLTVGPPWFVVRPRLCLRVPPGGGQSLEWLHASGAGLGVFWTWLQMPHTLAFGVSFIKVMMLKKKKKGRHLLSEYLLTSRYCAQPIFFF